ncbi:bacterioferritin-associated ferredoxin [Tepidimonas sp.]|uniref:(2Fe-2S)-binding protein n=1 Tax=Tepidimonas sp. TaxID=2002775 RepID=UPI0028CD3580|nr:(2Fe-2S)-binding protein [Tepidimonas sp.]MDT7927997.1 (2Fe-2S)-binding protein [Tepidimonas sp.]
MIVCICHRVSDRTIRAAARQGQAFEDLQFEHGVATCCGRCEACARDIWAQACCSQCSLGAGPGVGGAAAPAAAPAALGVAL